MFFVRAVIEGLNEILLRVEVVVGIPERHTSFLGNRAHRSLFISALAKHFQCSFENERLRLVAFHRPGQFVLARSAHETTSRDQPRVRSGIGSGKLVKLLASWLAAVPATRADRPIPGTCKAPTKPSTTL